MSRILIGNALGKQSLLSLEVGLSLARSLGMQAHVLHTDRLADYDTLDSVFAHLNLEVKDNYVDSILKGNTEIMRKQIEEVGGDLASVAIESRSGVPAEILVEEAMKEDVGLLVLGHDPHKKLVDIFLGKVTEDVIHRSSKSVLVVKDKKAINPKKILLAYDTSFHREDSFDWAKIIGKNFGAEIHLVNVVPCHYQGYRDGKVRKNSFTEAIEEMIEENIQEGQAKLEEKRSLFDSQEYEVISKVLVDQEGSISDCLTNYIKEEDIDLVIVGANSKGKIAEFLLGSVTSRILKKSPVSVLVTTA